MTQVIHSGVQTQGERLCPSNGQTGTLLLSLNSSNKAKMQDGFITVIVNFSERKNRN